MHQVEFYADSQGNEPVKDFLVELQDMPYMRHLDGDIWEIRPQPERVLFFSHHNGKSTKGMIDMGTNFNDLWNNSSFISEEQRNKIDFEVALIGKLIEARESKGLSQKQLADMCGLKQSAIARLEKMNVTPQLNTLIKVLKPLGYRLDIVPCD